VSGPTSLEERAFRAVEAFRSAEKAADNYNDFGSVLGVQDEITEICETLMHDLGRAATRSRRLENRIKAWEKGERTVSMLRGVQP